MPHLSKYMCCVHNNCVIQQHNMCIYVNAPPKKETTQYAERNTIAH